MTLSREISEKIQENLEELNLAQEKYGGVYVSQEEESTGLNLEVKTDEDTVSFTVRVELGALQETTPHEVYELLVDSLAEENIDTFSGIEEWEEALGL